MNRLKSSMLVVLAVIMTVSFALGSTTPTQAQGSAALSIAPRKDYTIEPGKSIEDTLLIRNIDTERPLNLSLRPIDFTFTDDGGTPKLMLAEDAPQTTWSLKPFIDINSTVIIEPGQSQSVPIKITIPENQGAGSYYSAIVYSSGASDGGNVGLSASGVTLVFVNIPGEVHEDLLLKKVGAYDTDARKYQFFTMDMPLNIGYTLQNDGNVAENPVGSITIRNLVLGRESTINDMNPNDSLALIGQTRTFATCIMVAKEQVDFEGTREEATKCATPGLWPGLYSVELSGFYGQNGNNTKEFSGRAYFLYAPWWFIIAVILILLFLSYHIWRFTRFIKMKRGGRKLSVHGKK